MKEQPNLSEFRAEFHVEVFWKVTLYGGSTKKMEVVAESWCTLGSAGSGSS